MPSDNNEGDALHASSTCLYSSDNFTYNTRSELIQAELGTKHYAYSYDNIGNRKTAQELAEESTYEANQLNQYTDITQSETPFTPTFDADGNQTLIKTSTGIWSVSYNADNRPTSFTQSQGDQNIIIECGYDYTGRRYMKKVTSNGTVSLHQRYIYRGYLQIACVDLRRSEHPALWYITWDPTEPIATRPLAIQLNATWYTYSQDLTKNVTELYKTDGHIATSYDYSPYGAITARGIDQPLQWSSEYHDPELALTYYNYRHYNPTDGRWINRDPIGEGGGFNLYGLLNNSPLLWNDILGLIPTVEELIEDVGPFDSNNDGIVDECWCEKFAKILNKLAMDPSIRSLNGFVSTLGSLSPDGESFLNTIALALAKNLNDKHNIATKLFKPSTIDEGTELARQFSQEKLDAVGLKPELVANGTNNVQHFIWALAWGRSGARILQLADRAQRFVTTTGSNKYQERTAEIAGDRAAAGAYRDFGRELDRDLSFWENKDSNKTAWKENRDKLADIWRKRFCRGLK